MIDTRSPPPPDQTPPWRPAFAKWATQLAIVYMVVALAYANLRAIREYGWDTWSSGSLVVLTEFPPALVWPIPVLIRGQLLAVFRNEYTIPMSVQDGVVSVAWQLGAPCQSATMRLRTLAREFVPLCETSAVAIYMLPGEAEDETRLYVGFSDVDTCRSSVPYIRKAPMESPAVRACLQSSAALSAASALASWRSTTDKVDDPAGLRGSSPPAEPSVNGEPPTLGERLRPDHSPTIAGLAWGQAPPGDMMDPLPEVNGIIGHSSVDRKLHVAGIELESVLFLFRGRRFVGALGHVREADIGLVDAALETHYGQPRDAFASDQELLDKTYTTFVKRWRRDGLVVDLTAGTGLSTTVSFSFDPALQ